MEISLQEQSQATDKDTVLLCSCCGRIIEDGPEESDRDGERHMMSCSCVMCYRCASDSRHVICFSRHRRSIYATFRLYGDCISCSICFGNLSSPAVAIQCGKYIPYLIRTNCRPLTPNGHSQATFTATAAGEQLFYTTETAPCAEKRCVDTDMCFSST